MSKHLHTTTVEVRHDCDYTDEIRCPICGYEHANSWDYDIDESGGEVDCAGCGESFYVHTNIRTTYSSCCITHDFKHRGYMLGDDDKEYKTFTCCLCGATVIKEIKPGSAGVEWERIQDSK